MKRFHVHVHVHVDTLAKWMLDDPSKGDAPDDQKFEAFRKTVHLIKCRFDLLIKLPSGKLDKALLQTTARELAKE
jgi:hypothetical protein